MLYTTLGNTDIKVSKICLGTMTWGQQNTMEEAHQQLDFALDAGINFIDTAEMYSVPPRPHTYGSTETYIGHWIAARKNRDNFILATKAVGPGPKHIRQGPKFNREQLTLALENSLKRLQTNYIDLYQLHWPERKTNFFGRLGYVHREDDPWEDNLHEILEILNDFIKQGKIRYIGISNETPWATMKYINLAERHHLPRLVSIQNPYSLINRTFEIGLAEIAMREKVGLLAYSPLAFGLLTGKYFNGNQVNNARLSLFPEMSRYNGELSRSAAQLYVDLARENRLSPAQMALAYVNNRPFVTSNIIGATSMEQLRENIHSIDIELSEGVIKEIESIHELHPNPAP